MVEHFDQLPQIEALSQKDCVSFTSTCTEAQKAFHGLVKRVKLRNLTQFLLFACRRWSFLQTLAVCKIAPQLLGSVTQSNSPQLKAVRLVHMNITPSSVLQLNTSWRDLRSLRLTNTNVQMAWLLSVTWPRLEVLWLHHGSSVSEELPPESATSHMPRLRELSLMWNQMSNALLLRLARCWPLLQYLNLNSCMIDTWGPDALTGQVGTYNWAGLRMRHLSINCALSPTRISAFTRKSWPDLTSLSLRTNVSNLIDPHFHLLGLHQLQHVDLMDNELGDGACFSLQSAQWPLRTLLLCHTKITSAGVRFLAMGQWPTMQNFALSSNEAGNAYVSELINAGWPLLEELDLSGNHIDRNDIACVFRGQWPHLRVLNVTRNLCRNAPCAIFRKASG